MTKTAVEWLYERLERMIPRTALYNMDKEDYFQQAKELEKQQNGYSEEDMISFAHFYFQEEFNSTMQTSKSTANIFKEWFEQFKKLVEY